MLLECVGLIENGSGQVWGDDMVVGMAEGTHASMKEMLQ